MLKKKIITANLWKTDYILESIYCYLKKLWILFIGFQILIMIYEPQGELSSIFLLTRNSVDCYTKVKADLLV